MSNCETCKKVQNEPESVPYIVHESAMARAERAARRLWITNLILIFLFVVTIIGFVYYENQFEDVVTTTTIEAEQDGSAVNSVGGGDVDYGAESEGG